MTLTRFALAHLRAMPVTTLLNITLLALGTASIAVLMLVGQQTSQMLTRNAENIDLVLGAKGSPVQLVLSSVYHADIPTGNISLTEAEQWADNRQIATAVPLSLGDSLRGFRIVGTTPDYLTLYGATVESGQMWNAPMQAVIGADVAAATGLGIGAQFVGAHGLSGMGDHHAAQPYRVVGQLSSTGTVIDRLVLTSLESVWDIHAEDQHDHAENNHSSAEDSHKNHSHKEHPSPSEEHPHKAQHENHHSDEAEHPDEHSNEHLDEHTDEDSDAHRNELDEHPHHAAEDDREITAMLLSYQSPLAALTLPQQINRDSSLQAAAPAFELARLLQLVGIGLDGLWLFALILVVSAALSIFAALYGALHQRRGDLALMRCLGATRLDLLKTLLIEGLLLTAAGILLGLLLGHSLVELIGYTLQDRHGVSLTGLIFLPVELGLVAGLLFTGLLAALLPAWQAYRIDVSRTLAQS